MPQSRLVIDWYRLISDITRTGISGYDLADQTGIARSTIMGWRDGIANPKWDDGEVIIALWCRVKDLDRSLLPRMPKPVSAAKMR